MLTARRVGATSLPRHDMNATGTYYSLIAMDIERYSSRSNLRQRLLRQELHKVLNSTLETLGLSFESTPKSDRADGYLLAIPTTTPRIAIAQYFVEGLRAALIQQAGPQEVQMRLRVALHSGEVDPDGGALVGSEANYACNLVELPTLRKVLAASTQASIALAASDYWYRSVVAANRETLKASEYGQLQFRDKCGQLDRAWLHVSGYVEPPGLDADAEDDSQRQKPSPPPSRIAFHGAVTTNNVIAGDQHNYGVGKTWRND